MRDPFYSDEWVTIYHGDALEVLAELEFSPLEVGAVVTDPPYSSGGLFRGDRTQLTSTKYVDTRTQAIRPEFSGDNRDQRSFTAWAALWLGRAFRISSEGALVASFVDWRQLPAMTDAIQVAGWVWRGIATWHKPGIRMQRGRFSGSAEFLVWGTSGAWLDHDGAPQNVFAHPPVPGNRREHIAEKPLPVLGWALQAVPPGAVVLDPFCGVGTTLAAAKARGLRSVGIELDERCCTAAAKRVAQGALFAAQG